MASTARAAYESLEARFARLAKLGHAETFLHWDAAVMMPSGGAEGRAEALAELGAVSHELLTHESLGETFSKAEGVQADLSPEQSINLAEMKRSWQQATCLPVALVQALTIAGSKCEHAWRDQRQANDWAGFLPNLKPVLELAREEARCRQAAEPDRFATPYDALLDLYANGDSSEFIAEVFDDLKSCLPGILQNVIEKQKSRPKLSLPGPFPVAAQQQLSHTLMDVLGFDFEAGRLDVSTHPFSTGDHGDNRITTRYNDDEFLQALLATAHETGHASYEAGLPLAWKNQPAGQARNMSIHESQSLLFERQIFNHKSFTAFLAPKVRSALSLPDSFGADQMWQLNTHVEAGFTRVEADEVSYPMHVILRYEIESALINGSLEAEDIPDAWDEKMQAYLGLSTAGNYKDGCMQDMHWTDGSFGYFPTYTLGALNAAQLFATHRDQNAGLNEQLAAGDVSAVKAWLQQNIWSKASFLQSQQLLQEATGEGTHAKYFLDHIQARYLDERY
jgi:carboxypeptidase Taq